MSPRIRTIKPEFWTDRKISRLPRDVRLFYIGLWNQADDEGRFIASIRTLLGTIFPYEKDLKEQFVKDALRKLLEAERVVLYEDSSGEQYGAIINWKKHQRINRPSESRIPPPPNNLDDSVSDQCALTVGSGTGNREQGGDKFADDVREVFTYWVATRADTLGHSNGPRPVLSAARSSKVRARLVEGYDVATIKRAVDSCMASKFHVSGGHLDIELICRDQGKIDGFLHRQQEKGDAGETGRARPLKSGGFYVGN